MSRSVIYFIILVICLALGALAPDPKVSNIGFGLAMGMIMGRHLSEETKGR